MSPRYYCTGGINIDKCANYSLHSKPYMFALYVCLICMCASYSHSQPGSKDIDSCLCTVIHMSYMDALYVCLICMCASCSCLCTEIHMSLYGRNTRHGADGCALTNNGSYLDANSE